MPPVKAKDRKIKERRSGLPRGCFLNSRWMEIRPNWDVWDLVKDVNPHVNIVAKKRLAEEEIIIWVEDRWYIMIYEVVSGLNKLLRQQVHRDARYEDEKARKSPLVFAIEKRLAEYAFGQAKLTAEEFSELTTLQLRTSRRLRDITVTRSHLAFRRLYVYAIAEATLMELRSLTKSLELAAINVQRTSSQNFGVYLTNIAEKLSVIYTMDIWRQVYWAQWNIYRAAECYNRQEPDRSQHYLVKAASQVNKAFDILISWSDRLPLAERQYIARF